MLGENGSGQSNRRVLDENALFLFDDIQHKVGDRPVDVGQGKNALDKIVEVIAALEIPDDQRIPFPGAIVTGPHAPVRGNLLLGFQKLALGDTKGDDGDEVGAEIVRIDDRYVTL